MATTAKNLTINLTTTPLVNQAPATSNFFQRAWNNYLAYAEKEGGNRLVWYCKTLLVLPCAFMVPLVIAMMHLTPAFHFYAGLLILLLFSNVIIHVAQMSGRIFVPLYHATIAVMLAIPLLTYLFTL